MPGIKEVSIHRSAKLLSLGAEQPIINRQSADAIKQINKQIRVLQDRLQRLEESKAETFKYMKGTLSNDRTVPNKMGEVVFKSSNQTVDARIYDNIVDLKIKNLTNAMCLAPAELAQLCKIDSVTISNAQWGYLGAMDQGVATTNSPTFAGLFVTPGNISLDTGYVDTKAYYYIDGDKIISVDGVDNMFFGKNSGIANINGSNNATLGVGALAQNINGIQNLAIGTNSLSKTKANNCVGVGVSTARNNVLGTSIVAIATNALFTHVPATATSAIAAIGASCFYYNSIGYRHVGLGTSAGFYQQAGHGDSYLGYEAGRGLALYSASYSTISGYRAAYGIATGADYNAIYGANSGYNIGGATRCCFFGPFAGYYETASNKLFIDNQTRTNEATSRVESLIYGIFAAVTANQEFHINAKSFFLEDMLIRGASKNFFRDTAIGIYSQADTFLDLFADGAVRIGDSSGGAPTNYVEVESDGDINFVGGAGLQFGEISYHGAGVDTVLAAQDTDYQVLGFNTNGDSNGDVTPDHTNDHITVGKAGRYKIGVQTCSRSAQANIYHFHPKINNGATQITNVAIHRETSVANKIDTGYSSGYYTLSANDTVGLWVHRIDGGAVAKTITSDHLLLKVEQKAG